MTLCSPDPQAFRPPEETVNVLQVTLPTNFKVARFDSDEHTAMLRDMQADIEAIRFDAGDGDKIELPVKLKVHDCVFVPLAKWAMLLTGNYRCVTKDGPRADQGSGARRPRGLARGLRLGARAVRQARRRRRDDLVPFEKYAAAAQGLARPSSAARALFAGAPNIERVDRLVQAIAAQKGMRNPVVDETVALVDDRLAANRKAAADRRRAPLPALPARSTSPSGRGRARSPRAFAEAKVFSLSKSGGSRTPGTGSQFFLGCQLTWRPARRFLTKVLRDLSAVGSPHRTLALPEVSAQARSDASGHLPIRFQPFGSPAVVRGGRIRRRWSSDTRGPPNWPWPPEPGGHVPLRPQAPLPSHPNDGGSRRTGRGRHRTAFRGCQGLFSGTAAG